MAALALAERNDNGRAATVFDMFIRLLAVAVCLGVPPAPYSDGMVSQHSLDVAILQRTTGGVLHNHWRVVGLMMNQGVGEGVQALLALCLAHLEEDLELVRFSRSASGKTSAPGLPAAVLLAGPP
jgi:hypothetical protein